MKSFIQKSFFISLFLILGFLTTAINAEPTSTSTAVEEIDIAKVAESIRVRSESLDKELGALIKDLPKKLTEIKQVEQQFEAMFKVVNNVLAYLSKEGQLVSSLIDYHNYAESKSRSLGNNPIKKLQALAKNWDIRAARVIKLMDEISDMHTNGIIELKRLQENKSLAIEVAELKMFDNALDATQNSIDKIKGVITDIKSISDKVKSVEKSKEETTTE